MPIEEYKYGVCGVFCEICPSGTGRIANLAAELLKLTKDSYKWAEENVDFKFEDLWKGLDWLTKDRCPTCLSIKEPWCKVLKCEKAKKLNSCLLCDEFLECPKTSYHRDRYPFVKDHHQRVKKIGLKKHFKEERKKAKKGITLNDMRAW